MTDDFSRRPKAVEGVPRVKNIEELSEWLKKNSDEEPAMVEDFLRRHPEIEIKAQEWFDEARADYIKYGELMHMSVMFAAVLPAILRAHKTDLAGSLNPSTVAQLVRERITDAQYTTLIDWIKDACAIAHLAGRAAGREEAAKVADLPPISDPILDFDTCEHIATAIRSLP